MVTAGRRAASVLVPLALLALFLATFRHTADGGAGDAQTSVCERPDPKDLALLERCIALDPSDVELTTALGAAYEQAGRADRAEASYRRALTLDPNNGELHLRLGLLLLARGDRAAAQTEAQAAIRLQPGRAAPQDLLQRAAAGSAR